MNTDTLANRLRRRITRRLFIDRASDERNTVLLAGTGRSGTTWISDVINWRRGYRYMFEPFYPQKVDICRAFRYRQYLRPDNREDRFLGPASAILSGRVRNRWIDGENKKFIARKRLVKDIRANLLLGWIHAQFPAVPIILIMRHPCAVANSKIRLNWGTHIEEFLAQPELMEDFLAPFEEAFRTADDVFDRHILLWCVEHYVPLRQFRRGEIHLAFYESFCESPEQEVRRLCSFLGEPFDGRILAGLGHPSTKTRQGSAIVTGASLTESWRKHLSETQTRRAVELLSLFGMDGIYREGAMPDIEGAYRLMKADDQPVGTHGPAGGSRDDTEASARVEGEHASCTTQPKR